MFSRTAKSKMQTSFPISHNMFDVKKFAYAHLHIIQTDILTLCDTCLYLSMKILCTKGQILKLITWEA